MENFKDFITPELLVLIPVMYYVGMGLKKSNVKDKYIPFILGGASVALACLYVLGANGLTAIGAFTAITQGILCAGCSTYVNQCIKQATKDE